MARRILSSITPDLAPLRQSRDYRLLITGTLITGLGTQAALVALPYQVYVMTHRPVLVGLLGLVELGPLIAASLVGGAFADRLDRRRMLLLCQMALVAIAARPRGGRVPRAVRPCGCSTCSPGRWPRPGRSSGSARSSIVPNVVPPESLRAALATSFGINQLTMVVGPGAGRPADRRLRRGSGVHGRRRQLPRHGGGGGADVAAASAGGRAARAGAARDRLRPALRARRARAGGQLRHRPAGDDLRDAAGAVPGAGAHASSTPAPRAPVRCTPRWRPGRPSPR